MKNQSS